MCYVYACLFSSLLSFLLVTNVIEEASCFTRNCKAIDRPFLFIVSSSIYKILLNLVPITAIC